MELELLYYIEEDPFREPVVKTKAPVKCNLPQNTSVFCCEMLDENVCKCFAFDSNDGLHWTAVGLGIVILLVAVYAYTRYRKNLKKKKNGRDFRMLPMQEIVSQCQQS